MTSQQVVIPRDIQEAVDKLFVTSVNYGGAGVCGSKDLRKEAEEAKDAVLALFVFQQTWITALCEKLREHGEKTTEENPPNT